MGRARIGLLLIGAVLLVFSLMSFSPAGRDLFGASWGLSYDPAAKIGAATGSALMIAGLLLSRKPK